MEINVKKKNSEIISCGMSMLVLKDEEGLDTHLVTCKLYKHGEWPLEGKTLVVFVSIPGSGLLCWIIIHW